MNRKVTSKWGVLPLLAAGIVLCLLWPTVGGAGLAAPGYDTLQKVPQRIVSLGPIITENIFLLGAEDNLVGDTVHCTRPAGARHKVKVGSVMEVGVEKILSLEPDLVLATGLTSTAAISRLQTLGVRVVRFQQPASFHEICEQFLELGRLLGRRERARDIVAEVTDKANAIREMVAKFAPQKVFLQVGSQPLFGSVDTSFTHDFIELANGINVIGDQADGRTNYEKVIVADPDVIIIAMMGSESGVAGAEKQKWEQFPAISAVRQGRISIVDPDIACSPSPATFIEALTLMTRLIHPELAEVL